MQPYSPILSPFEMLLEAAVGAEHESSLPPLDEPFCNSFNFSEVNTRQQVYTFVFVSLFCMSVIGLLFIATTILYSDKLQSHP